MNNFKRKTNFISWLTIVGLIVSFIGLPTQVNAATVYKYEWMAQSGNVSKDGLAHEYNNLQPGQTIDLSLTLRNRSGKTIQARSRLGQSQGEQVPIGAWGIGTQNPQDGTPSFLDSSSFVLNNNRFVYYDGENSLSSDGEIPDGFMINFSWTVKLKNNLANGTYYLYLRPVCEYLAWTRQFKNGVTFSGTDSDIYWKFRVGNGDDSDVPAGYVRYVNSKYGFSFVYQKPVYPNILGVEDNLSVNIHKSYIFCTLLGGIEAGSINSSVGIYRDQDLNRVISSIETPFINEGVDYTKQSTQLNGINWTIFKYHQEYGDSNEELRIGQLPNGYVIGALYHGFSRSAADQVFLNSVKYVPNDKVYINNQFGFRLNIPDGYKSVVYNNPQYELFGMSIDTETPEGIGGYEDNVRISITSCSLDSDLGSCLLEPDPLSGMAEAAPKFMGYITIGGKNSVWYDGTTGGSYYHYYVFDGKSYKFSFISLPNSKIIDDILSSFQFI